jgi:nicotinic acid mononucleotide adenylyltransferase
MSVSADSRISEHPAWHPLQEAVNVSVAELDRVFAELSDEACADPDRRAIRYAWRALRDPFYRSVCRRYGPESLDEAGFFDDGATPRTIAEPEDTVNVLCTPTHKIRRLLERAPAGARKVALLTTGAFSPPHAGHLEMMQTARAALTERGMFVCGGWLSPGHDDYVGGKYGGTAALSAAHRVVLCEHAVADSDWLMVDPWEAQWTGTAVNFTDVLRRLHAYLRHHVADDIETWYVFGGDNAGFARAFTDHAGCVCVSRDGSSSAVSDAAADRVLVGHDSVVFASAGASHSGLSSRAVRERRDDPMIAAVRQQCESWRFGWHHGSVSRKPSQQSAARAYRYAMRDDLQWATSGWQHRLPAAALERFREGLTSALERAFGHVTWPDQPQNIECQLIDRNEQAEYVNALQRKVPVISLDVATEGTYQFGLSRLFACGDGQLKPLTVVQRPGTDELSEQAGRIPPGEYVLVDDDIATGFMMDQTQRLLGPQVVAAETVSLTDAVGVRDPFDVVDLRDFVLGARAAGLVMEDVRGHTARSIYALPYVRPASRAKLPPSAEWEFSRTVWQLNCDLFSETDLRLCDLDGSCQTVLTAAGYQLTALAADVCADHARRLCSLPFTPPMSDAGG